MKKNTGLFLAAVAAALISVHAGLPGQAEAAESAAFSAPKMSAAVAPDRTSLLPAGQAVTLDNRDKDKFRKPPKKDGEFRNPPKENRDSRKYRKPPKKSDNEYRKPPKKEAKKYKKDNKQENRRYHKMAKPNRSPRAWHAGW